MSEKDEEVISKNRNEAEETKAKISDNTRAIEDFENKYKEEINKIESLGYSCKIESKLEDGKEVPFIILIYKEKDMVASYTVENGHFEIYDQKLKNLFDLAKKMENEREEQRQMKDHNSGEKAEKSEDSKKGEEEKEEEKKGELTKEEIQEQLGDKYVVAEVINDEEVSRALIGTEGFTGNPMIAFNKEEKKFEIVGNKGGKLEKAKLPTMPATTGTVKRYNHDGSIINEEKGNVSSELLLINGGKDGIELGVSDYGEIILNKQLNVGDINQESRMSVPIDTTQKVPTTKEIQEMKKTSEKTDEVNKKLDEMEIDGIISKEQRIGFEKNFASNGRSSKEDLEELEKFKKAKLESKDQEEKEEEETEEYDDSWFIYGKPRSH